METEHIYLTDFKSLLSQNFTKLQNVHNILNRHQLSAHNICDIIKNNAVSFIVSQINSITNSHR